MAACLIHPLDPTHTGASPSSLLHVSSLQALLVLADKYNMQVCGGEGGVEGEAAGRVCCGVHTATQLQSHLQGHL